jgi:DNA-binding transcriptional regulator YiaG
MGYTSTDVKRRYNEKTYKRWFLSLKNEDFDKIEEIREATELSRAEFLKMLVSERYDIKF